MATLFQRDAPSGLSLLLAGLTVLLVGAREPQGVKPTLNVASAPTAAPRVIGRHWPARVPVSVTVRYFDLTARAAARTTRAGVFGLEIHNARWCNRLTVDVRDTRGHHVRLHGAGTGSCDAPTVGSRITVHALSSREMRYQEVVADTRHLLPQYTLHVGDTLRLYEPGSDPTSGGPFVTPHPQSDALRLIDQGSVPACPANQQCQFDVGFYWRYQAVRPGLTGIGLAARCRQIKPPCMMPDRLIRVQILP